MIKTIKYTFAIIALLTISTATNAGNTTFKAKLDSATLLMGNVVGMQMEIVQDKGKTGYILVNEGDTLTKNVEIVGWLKSDTSDIGNGREQINRTLILQSFDSGLYTLPPILYVAGRDTFKTNKLTLKVIPVDVDSLKDIHDYKTTEDPGSKWYDFLPDFITDYWWIYFVVLILLAIGLYIYYRIKKGKPIRLPFVPVPKVLPPYEEAMQALSELKGQSLWQNGQEKEYYSKITDILRHYINRRFGVEAMEMTTTQILDVLNHEDAKDAKS
ncbi:MAG: cell wall anchor protein, partial [Candidatus Limisoma sp.]